MLSRGAHHLRPVAQAHRRLVTLASTSREIAGVALHSGVNSRVRLAPAAASDGIHFVRVDLPGEPVINADVSSVVSTVLSTKVGWQDATVATIEHLMAALCGLGVRACRIEVDAAELPVLDGSAAEWVTAIRDAGLVSTDAAAASAFGRTADAAGSRRRAAPLSMQRVVLVEEGDSWAIAMPSQAPRLTVGIDFPGHVPIGRQWASWAPEEASTSADTFAREVAPARTFALAEQLESLRERGLIRGGSLDNALVCDAERWLNDTPPRFANEPARHKLLDLMGDISLLGGTLPLAHIVAFRAGHRLHVALAEAIAADAEAHSHAAQQYADYSWISDAVISARRGASS